MTASARAPLYDLFKMIVAILLLLIFLFLLFSNRSPQARQLQVVDATMTTSPSTSTVAPASSTPLPPTATLVPTNTSTPISSLTLIPTLTATALPAPTESPVPETLPTPIVEIPSETNVCEAVSRSQLQVGMQATVARVVNLRSSPGIFNNWILTNHPGIQVEIIGGPNCTRYKNGGAYLWWQVKLPNGLTGWSAEASAFGAFYFMEPVK
ncbi:MAG: hypothetical protein ABI904_12125 [Chloroflexota bacterium]